MSATIAAITRETITANDARLEGRITREQYAVIISDINDRLAANGWTWDDIHNEINKGA
jgi:hypothetical protein